MVNMAYVDTQTHISACCTIILERAIFPQFFKKFPAFVEQEVN
jgi:hypothetical protein